MADCTAQETLPPEAAADSSRRRALAVFDSLTRGGRPGQMLSQGVGNYYQTDALERRHFELFVAALGRLPQEMGRRVLVVGCGDGLETELLAESGFDVTAFDFSAHMVDACGVRLDAAGVSAHLVIDDVTAMRLDQYHGDFAGIMFAQVAAFIPTVSDERLLRKAFKDLISLAANGAAFHFSTTRYPSAEHEREWFVDGVSHGVTTYFGRDLAYLEAMITDAGVHVSHSEFFDAHTLDPTETYQNQYVLGDVGPHYRVGGNWVHHQRSGSYPRTWFPYTELPAGWPSTGPAPTTTDSTRAAL